MTYVGHKGEKGAKKSKKQEARIARGTAIDMDSRLRGGRAIAKTEEEIAPELMHQVKKHAPDEKPPSLATDGKGAYRQAMLQIGGKVPQQSGQGRPATLPKPDKDWQYLQMVKKRQGGRLVRVRIKVVSGDPEEVKATYRISHGFRRTNQSDLTTDEWAGGSQNLLVFQGAPFAESCELLGGYSFVSQWMWWRFQSYSRGSLQ